MNDITYNERVWVFGTSQEVIDKTNFYLDFLQTTFDPNYHIFEMFNYEGMIAGSGGLVAVPQPYYIEMNKANLVNLFLGPQAGNPLVAQCADTIFGSEVFGLITTQESPRETWSHGE